MWRTLLVLCLCGAIAVEGATAGVATGDRIGSTGPASADRQSAVVPGTRPLALVIGNGAYRDHPLANAADDARMVSLALDSLGFDVMSPVNLTERQMEQAIREFEERLAAGGVGLFYFAGHGFRVGHTTFLAAVDADGLSTADMVAKSIDLRTVLRSMSRPRPGKLNLVILDTCLNGPFRTPDPGADRMPAETLIAYATAPGSFAGDGARHGIYTAELLKAMVAPGGDVKEMFQRVATAVRRATGERQAPSLTSSLSRPFRFPATTRPGLLPSWASAQDEVVLALESRGVLPKDSAEQYEIVFWESIKDSTHVSDYEAYLKAYPNGRFATLARARIERLRAAAPKAETPREPVRPAPAPKAPAAAARPAPESPAVSPRTPAGSAGLNELKDCPSCPVLVALPNGELLMGSNASDPSEKPAHRVSINAPFAIGKYEVTVEQWNACVAAGACPRIAANDNSLRTPARDLSWDDAQQYVKWLGKVTGKPYRLPTESEWEYAARGGSTTRYWWGEQMTQGKANCKGCGEPWRPDAPAAVGSFAANPYGLHDVNGSVWEWVSDCWHSSYKGAPADGRSWDDPQCRVRVIRGGSWRDDPSYMPSTTRFKYDASVRYSQNGLRVARDLK